MKVLLMKGDGRMINKRVYDAMNEQIKQELESAYIYLSMVGYFHAKNLDGMAHWLRVQTHEETIHAMKFFDHLTSRGASPATSALPASGVATTEAPPLGTPRGTRVACVAGSVAASVGALTATGFSPFFARQAL